MVCYFSVEGGELFDRIIDENYQLTEMDAIVFTRQICEGVQYLHQQYILHLDLKVNSTHCTECYNVILMGLAVHIVSGISMEKSTNESSTYVNISRLNVAHLN